MNGGGRATQRIKGSVTRTIYRYIQLVIWLARRRPSPPPPVIKQRAIRRTAKAYSTSTLIETGTHRGDTVAACLRSFRRIISVELGAKLAKEARQRFAAYPHVTIMQGDSGEVLTEILSNLDEKSLFWLDAHYSGGDTASGQEEAPVLRELRAIFQHRILEHVILIDDAREFGGNPAYPTIDAIAESVAKTAPHFRVEVRHDIIRLYPEIRDSGRRRAARCAQHE